MNRKTMRLVSLPLIAALFFSACKKDKDDNPAMTKENIAGDYTVTSMKVSATGVPEKDVLAEYTEACERDNIHSLKADLSYALIDAGVKCDDDASYTGRWSLDGTKITIDGQEGMIKKFDGKNLQVSYTQSGGGMTATLTTTLTRK